MLNAIKDRVLKESSHSPQNVGTGVSLGIKLARLDIQLFNQKLI